MLIHPSNFQPNPQIRQTVEQNLGMEPYTEYFHRTGPLVDVYETIEEIIVSCEIPGLEKKDDINIHLNGRSITITGIIQRASEDTRDNRYHRTERFFGNFYREVQLPEKVNEEMATASYKNGVLEIRMKKQKLTQGKQVKIDFH